MRIILSVIFLLVLAFLSVEGATGAGCKDTYCWAYCSFNEDTLEWCYTQGGNNMDPTGHARCRGTGAFGPDPTGKSKSPIQQCKEYDGREWKCNGPCRL